jgi:hypothetical protein
MTRNVGSLDKAIRYGLAGVFLAMILSGQVGTLAAVVVGIVGFALVITGSIGFCPAYLPLRLSTKGKKAGTQQ